MNCLQCNDETLNPKFCSKSCAGIYNGRKFPKRKVESTCKRCKEPNTKTRTYCKNCYLIIINEKSILNQETLTLKELKGKGSANAGGRYPMLRGWARKKYLASDKPKYCIVCKYNKHFDVCHIKDIKCFSEDTTIAIINHIDNLTALCKNHHWEYDNGLFYDIPLGLLPIIGKSNKGTYNI